MDIDNNVLTRTQADPRNSVISVSGKRYAILDKTAPSSGRNLSQRIPGDTLEDIPVHRTPGDLLMAPLDLARDMVTGVTNYTTRTPSAATLDCSIDLVDGVCASATAINKGRHLIHLRARPQGRVPQADFIAETAGVVPDTVLAVRALGCTATGPSQAVLAAHASKAGWTAGITAQSRPAFLAVINQGYRARRTDLSTGAHTATGSVSAPLGGGGMVGGSPVAAGVGKPMRGRHSSVGAPRTANNRYHMTVASDYTNINSNLLSGVDVLAAGLGCERPVHVYTDLANTLATHQSPLCLTERERELLDCPVFHLSLTRAVAPRVDPSPFVDAWLGARLSLSALLLQKHRDVPLDTLVSFPGDSQQHDALEAPHMQALTRSLAVGFHQQSRRYALSAELLDFGRHSRVMGLVNAYPRKSAPGPAPDETGFGLGSLVSSISSFVDSAISEFVEPREAAPVYPSFTAAVAWTSSLEEARESHRAEFERTHNLASRLKMEKQRRQTAEYLQAVGHAHEGLQSPRADGSPLTRTHSPVGVTTPAVSPPNADRRMPMSSPAVAGNVKTFATESELPLASPPPLPPMSPLDPKVYTSFARSLVNNVAKTHHVEVSCICNLSATTMTAVAADSNGNLRLSMRLRNSDNEQPFQRNSVRGPGTAAQLKAHGDNAKASFFGLPVSLTAQLNTSLRAPSLANSSVAVSFNIGDV
jgi:hypothetical protein